MPLDNRIKMLLRVAGGVIRRLTVFGPAPMMIARPDGGIMASLLIDIRDEND